MNMRPPPDHERPDYNYYLRRKLLTAHRRIMFFGMLATFNGIAVIVLALIIWWKL